MSKQVVLQLPSHFEPTHQTSGLVGFPAIDVFAKSDTPVACMVAGTVVKISGRPPTSVTKRGGPFGYSIYVARLIHPAGTLEPYECFEDVYFATHFQQKAENFWKVGAKFRRGQYMGKVGRYTEATNGKTPSHIHLGFHRGIWRP